MIEDGNLSNISEHIQKYLDQLPGSGTPTTPDNFDVSSFAQAMADVASTAADSDGLPMPDPMQPLQPTVDPDPASEK